MKLAVWLGLSAVLWIALGVAAWFVLKLVIAPLLGWTWA